MLLHAPVQRGLGGPVGVAAAGADVRDAPDAARHHADARARRPQEIRQQRLRQQEGPEGVLTAKVLARVACVAVVSVS